MMCLTSLVMCSSVVLVLCGCSMMRPLFLDSRGKHQQGRGWFVRQLLGGVLVKQMVQAPVMVRAEHEQVDRPFVAGELPEGIARAGFRFQAAESSYSLAGLLDAFVDFAIGVDGIADFDWGLDSLERRHLSVVLGGQAPGERKGPLAGSRGIVADPDSPDR